MGRDVLDLVKPFLSEDPSRWAKLSSDIQWRRLQLLLLSEMTWWPLLVLLGR